MSKIRVNQIHSGELAEFVDSLLNAQLTSLEDAVDTISGDLDLLEAGVSSLSGSLDLLSGDFVDMSGIFDVTLTKLDTLSGYYDDVVVDIATVSGQIAQLSGNYISVSGLSQTAYDNAALAIANVNILSGNLNTLTIALGITNGSLNTLQSQFNSLSGDYVYFKNLVNTFSGQVTGATGQLNSEMNELQDWATGTPVSGVSGYLDNTSGNVKYLGVSGGAIGIRFATGQIPSGNISEAFLLVPYTTGNGSLCFKYYTSGSLWRHLSLGIGAAASF